MYVEPEPGSGFDKVSPAYLVVVPFGGSRTDGG
jgi:hypothetical protein